MFLYLTFSKIFGIIIKKTIKSIDDKICLSRIKDLINELPQKKKKKTLSHYIIIYFLNKIKIDILSFVFYIIYLNTIKYSSRV